MGGARVDAPQTCTQEVLCSSHSSTSNSLALRVILSDPSELIARTSASPNKAQQRRSSRLISREGTARGVSLVADATALCAMMRPL